MKLLRISKIFKLRHLTLRPFYYPLNSTIINLYKSIHMSKTNFAHVLIHQRKFIQLFREFNQPWGFTLQSEGGRGKGIIFL